MFHTPYPRYHTYHIQAVLAPYDRVAIGGELLLFKWKALETSNAGPIPTAEEAVMEFKRAMQVCVTFMSKFLLSVVRVTGCGKHTSELPVNDRDIQTLTGLCSDDVHGKV